MPWWPQSSVPGELVAAEERLFADLGSTGWFGCCSWWWRLSASATAAGGFSGSTLTRFRERTLASPLDTPRDRGRTVLARLLYGLAWC